MRANTMELSALSRFLRTIRRKRWLDDRWRQLLNVNRSTREAEPTTKGLVERTQENANDQNNDDNDNDPGRHAKISFSPNPRMHVRRKGIAGGIRRQVSVCSARFSLFLKRILNHH
jgi:hypothetical protein